MPDYKTMYYKMFNAVTDSIEILKQAQLESEELYIESSEKDENKITELKVIKKDKNSK